MKGTLNKIIFCYIFLFCCHALCMGQNKDNILLKYNLAKEEFKNIDKEIIFPSESLQNRNYRKIIHYDTAFSQLDTLFIVLPDNRKYEKQRVVNVVHTGGISNIKKIYCSKLFMHFHHKNVSKLRFVQSIPIQTDKRIVVLKCNWYTLVFEKEEDNQYELKNVYQEDFNDYVNKFNGTQDSDNNDKPQKFNNEKYIIHE